MKTRWFATMGAAVTFQSVLALAQAPTSPPADASAPVTEAPAVPAESGVATPAPKASTESQDGASPPPTAPPPSVPAQAPMSELASPAPPPPEDSGPPTLLGGKKATVGGYGGLAVVGSSMKGQGVVYVGGEGALLVAHRLALGLGGYGLATRIMGPDNAAGEAQRLSFGYGGLVVRYNCVERRPYYLSFGALVGAGGAAYTNDWGKGYREDWDDDHVDADPVFVLEPSIGAHLNLTRWARIGAQVSYRFVSGIDELEQVRDRDLAGFAYGGNLQLGWF